ncbi:MAG: hypothetical protein JF887_00985 [Candidatus Dormibacteraeota bacterium]|uniref:Uncharacterized protein n=1 Tax=Candidatus Amunia macphersoniae TaxID=3127014 RepID=A0A934KCV6_9BACT|nr:hypothetical protein [Candidatus Dormibacteraeota bacterium]
MSTTPEYQRADAPPPAEQVVTLPADARGAVAARQSDEREDPRHRELNRFRGLNLGAAFFGWLVAVGIAALLAAVLGAAGAALTLTKDALSSTSTTTTLTLTITGAVLLAVILLLAYYAGGYVAGRLSRFSGGVQGFGVWVIGLLITVALAIAGVVAGSKYNVLAQLRLPSIPVNGQSFATGGAIALAALAILTLAAAILGGTMGLRYHQRVDRALRRV